ncbi:hypothetical protein K474DRAFT_1657617 [Panus rudis PR-1116 ss-1]|nr:hypothetical protein K474DRAFT_1657617 [Panus rudis PR-1116 ss-1]
MPPVSPASPFAALLRRSKFASYDPHIHQVYATYGGDAARGNFGLKRPLPLRRRQAFITVATVDSPEQQTEWKSAEQEARWIRMWDEVGCTPRVPSASTWGNNLGPTGEFSWVIDSDFAVDNFDVPSGRYDRGEPRLKNMIEEEDKKTDPLHLQAKKEGVLARDMAIENVSAMSDSEFEEYLEELRTQRPQFRKFLELKRAVEKKDDKPLPSFWTLSAQRENHDAVAQQFLSACEYKKYNAPESQEVENQPHKFAGLSYARGSALQDFLYTKPQPGHVINKSKSSWVDSRGNHSEYVVGFAGTPAGIPNELRNHASVIDWSELGRTGERKRRQQHSKYRFLEVELYNAPASVGPSQPPADTSDAELRKIGLREAGLQGVGLSAKVMAAPASGWSETGNPHRPGSKEYIAQPEGITNADKTMIHHSPRPLREYKWDKGADGPQTSKKGFLDTLEALQNGSRM